jgi:hypothetical protein
MELNEKKYFSQEAELHYVSSSQYKMFFNPYNDCCEAAALAQIRGEIERPMTTSLLMGSYVDEALTGDLERFKSEHPELISTRGESKGQLKKDYVQAEAMVQRAKKDPTFMAYVTGGIHQAIFTGEIGLYTVCDKGKTLEFISKADAQKYIDNSGKKLQMETVKDGVPVKIKIDHIAMKDGKPVAIVDLKTVKSMYETFYVKDSGEHLSFVERWNYDLQGAMYQCIYEQNTGLKLPFYIAAVSKDKDSEGVAHPRLKVIQIPQTKLDERLAEVKNNIGKIQMLKEGKIEPINCGKCDYCADTLPCEVISMDELLLEV